MLKVCRSIVQADMRGTIQNEQANVEQGLSAIHWLVVHKNRPDY
jgi:hypothetical protein